MSPDVLDDEDEGSEGGGEWMATFADLSTLLLTFFVLLLSFSNMDVVEFREMLGSVRDAFGVQKMIQGSVEAISSSPVELTMNQNDGAGMAAPHQEAPALDEQLLKSINKYIENKEMEGKVEVELTPRGVIVRVKEAVLYQSGSADLADGSAEVLDNIAEMQREFSDALQIEGHTDNVPMRSTEISLELGALGGTRDSVLRYLNEKQGIPADDMGVAGYADSKPLGPNDTAEGREANRRVEFVFRRDPVPVPVPESGADDDADDTDESSRPAAPDPADGRAFAIPMSAASSRARVRE